MQSITLELATVEEIIDTVVSKVKEQQKLKNLSNAALAQKADIPLKTFEYFKYKHKISLSGLIKLLMALELKQELETLMKPILAKDETEHKKLQKIRSKSHAQAAKAQTPASPSKSLKDLASKFAADTKNSEKENA
jgi:hypothetical protein